jgi:hypothetical protein
VDAEAWEKVTEGVYKGFSIGGRATKRDDLNKSIITGLKLTEISLVDRPANPEATFDVFKADGDDTSDDIAAEVDTTVAVDENEEPATLEFSEKADAVDDIAKTDDENVEQLSAVDTLADMLTKGFITPERVVELADADVAIAKGMAGVSWLAMLLKNIKYLIDDQTAEAEREGDGSTMPVDLQEWLTDGAVLLQLMTAEEASELAGTDVTIDPTLEADSADTTGMGDGVIALAEESGDIEKAGARNSKSDQDKIQTMHDHSVALGANCGSEKHEHSDGISVEFTDEMQKAGVTVEMNPSEIISKLLADRDGMTKRIVELEAQPTVGKALLRAIAKGDDVVVVEAIDKVDDEPVDLTGHELAKYQIMKMYQQ